MTPELEQRLKKKLEGAHRREDVFAQIPANSSRILEIGYGDGGLLLRLKQEKKCTELYGVEVNPTSFESMEGLIDGNWSMYLGEEDNHLGDEYHGFFNWIIMHDVLEHLYDPWYFLDYLRRYAAPGCKFLLVCPNAQYWQTIYSLLQGDFPYGLDGHFNEDHIRWFTPKSMIEMCILSGLRVDTCDLLLTSRINQELAQFLEKNKDGRMVSMPPVGVPHQEFTNYFPPFVKNVDATPQVDVVFKGGNMAHMGFYAVKILLVCSLADKQPVPRIGAGKLRRRREAFLENTPNYGDLLPKEWKAYIWHPG